MMWTLRDALDMYISTPVGMFTFAFCLMYFDYFFLVPRYFVKRVLHGPATSSRAELPSGLIVIPTLLRQKDEIDALKETIASVVANDYPGDLVVVASIDGYGEAPALYRDLCGWVASQQGQLPPRVSLHVTGTPERRGKPLAIENAVQHARKLVAAGVLPEFPKIYFSTDADADLGPHALEFIARRLCKKNWLTGSPGRAVAGNLYVRGNSFWNGWKHFFTVEGQLSIQVAREYLVTNIARYNLRPFPLSGITGVLYCTWTEIFTEGPRFMGFMRTLRITDWLKWWVGFAPPKFSTSDCRPIPDLLAGDTDDTVSAFLAIIARWDNGRFTLDAPRTPAHAAYYAFRSFFFDRALRYEPEARVFTSSPTTIKALWKQRVRWNAARIEVAGRFSRSYLFHWDLGICAIGVVMLMLKYVFFGGFYYLQVPAAMTNMGFFGLRLLMSYCVQVGFYGVWTLLALMMNGELKKNWRLMLALFASPIYVPVWGFWASAVGICKDVLLFGNCTRFAPETTLIRGGSTRIALLARVRRLMVLTIRAAVYGDVPFGAFWLGWGETPWTPSGYLGFSTGKIPKTRQLFRWYSSPAPHAATHEEPEENLVVARSEPIATVSTLVRLPAPAADNDEAVREVA